MAARDLAVLSILSCLLPGCAAVLQRADTAQVRCDSTGARAPAAEVAVREILRRENLPGLQVSVLRGGERLRCVGGSLDRSGAEPLAAGDAIRLGSTIKLFVAAVAIRELAAAGHGLDEPASRWVPGLPPEVTVRMLLSHRSGLGEILGSPALLLTSTLSPRHRWSPEQMARRSIALAGHDPPGAGFHYANSNYVLLGALIEALTGRPAEAVLRARFWAPLGLRSPCLPPRERCACRLATGYDTDLMPLPGAYAIEPGETSWASAASTSGALAASADDLAAAFEVLRTAPEWARVWEQMIAFQPAATRDVHLAGYGLGLMHIDAGGQAYLGHVGEFIGSTSLVGWNPATQATCAIAGTRSRFDVVRVCLELESLLPARGTRALER